MMKAGTCQFCGCSVAMSVNTCTDCARKYLNGEAVAEPATTTRGKPSGASPTELTLKECRRRGWVVAKTEYWQPSFATSQLVEAVVHGGDVQKALASYRHHGPGVRRDLLGFVDVLALPPDGILAIQATAGGGSGRSNAQARVRKIAGECGEAARAWLAAGGRIQVWGWVKPKHRWEVAVTEVTADFVRSSANDLRTPQTSKAPSESEKAPQARPGAPEAS